MAELKKLGYPAQKQMSKDSKNAPFSLGLLGNQTPEFGYMDMEYDLVRNMQRTIR